MNFGIADEEENIGLILDMPLTVKKKSIRQRNSGKKKEGNEQPLCLFASR